MGFKFVGDLVQGTNAIPDPTNKFRSGFSLNLGFPLIRERLKSGDQATLVLKRTPFFDIVHGLLVVGPQHRLRGGGEASHRVAPVRGG